MNAGMYLCTLSTSSSFYSFSFLVHKITTDKRFYFNNEQYINVLIKGFHSLLRCFLLELMLVLARRAIGHGTRVDHSVEDALDLCGPLK